MSSRFDSIIDEMADYIAGCKQKAFSSSKIEVERERLEEFLAELRAKYPDDVKRAQKVIAHHDDIIDEAQLRADEIKKKAEEKAAHLVNDNDIVQKAQTKADDIIKAAEKEAERILKSAQDDAAEITSLTINYTDGILENIQGTLENSLEITSKSFNGLKKSFDNILVQVKANRQELNTNREELSTEN